MEEFHCSFCGKQRREVRKLISGPRVFICDQCVTLCNDILAKEEASERPEYQPPLADPRGDDAPGPPTFAGGVQARIRDLAEMLQDPRKAVAIAVLGIVLLLAVGLIVALFAGA